MVPTFATATAVKATGSHTYTAHFPAEWCIGSVTHGGVVTATLLRVAAKHFTTTLAAQQQPHTIILHAEFLRRTSMGDATFTVKDVKIGRQMSTVHITLTQEGREEVVAYLTNSNMATESGITLQTGWSPNPPLPPPPDDFAKLATDGEDANWVLHRSLPYMKVRKAMNRVRIHIPRGGQAQPNVIDEWLRLESGERFTTEAVGFVCDMWPQVLEELLVRQLGKKKSDGSDPAWLWYPTVTLNLDFKKVLPPEGVDWLHVRIQAKQIKNGRYDYEIVIFDDTGDIVALSHHVVMVVDAGRNTAPRKDGSKI